MPEATDRYAEQASCRKPADRKRYTRPELVKKDKLTQVSEGRPPVSAED